MLIVDTMCDDAVVHCNKSSISSHDIDHINYTGACLLVFWDPFYQHGLTNPGMDKYLHAQ